MKFESAILVLLLLSGLLLARAVAYAGKAQDKNQVVSASELVS